LSTLAKIVPTCFLLGAGMESFMIVTGFYNIAGRKEAERRVERKEEESRMIARMAQLKVKYDLPETK